MKHHLADITLTAWELQMIKTAIDKMKPMNQFDATTREAFANLESKLTNTKTEVPINRELRQLNERMKIEREYQGV